MKGLAGQHWPVPDWHFKRIESEMACPDPKEQMMAVVARMPSEAAPEIEPIDWEAALEPYRGLEFPKYYLQPFHSVPGGYLSESAAMGDRQAMQAIYAEAHPRKCLGIRDDIAAQIPESARRVVDLGGGTGDGGAAVARLRPEASVLSIDASPFMVEVGRRQNADLANLEIVQGFAEDTGLEDDSVDAVMITLVLHECPDFAKEAIGREAVRILKPGGTLVLTDVPNDDLHRYRGFFEPYKEPWLEFDFEAFLLGLGLVDPRAADPIERLWTRVATLPAV